MAQNRSTLQTAELREIFHLTTFKVQRPLKPPGDASVIYDTDNLTGESSDSRGWKISSNGTRLTLVQPRPCVISCNVSNQHGSVVSTARLAVLPHGIYVRLTSPYFIALAYLLYFT